MSFCFCFFFLRDKRRLFCFCSSRGFASCRLQNSRGFFPQNRFSLALESHTREVREPHTPIRRVRREKKGVFRQSRSPFSPSLLASPQTSFGVRLSRIHKWMRDKRTPKDVCGEATSLQTFCLIVRKYLNTQKGGLFWSLCQLRIWQVLLISNNKACLIWLIKGPSFSWSTNISCVTGPKCHALEAT